MKEPKCSKLSDVMLCNEFKISVSVFLLLLAFSVYARTPDVIHELCLTGMFFCFVGDVLLMDYMKVPSQILKGKHFYFGMVSFGVAQLCYIMMYDRIADVDNLNFISKVLLLTFVLGAPLSIYESMREEKSFVFDVAAYTYSTVLGLTLAYACDCTIRLGGRYVFALLGVVCFIISDYLILIRETSTDTPFVRKLIWVFYPLAQIIIILSA